jgi:hypothetical protein
MEIETEEGCEENLPKKQKAIFKRIQERYEKVTKNLRHHTQKQMQQ